MRQNKSNYESRKQRKVVFFFFQLATEARWEAKLGRRQQRKLQCCKCSRIAFVVASV